MQVIIALRDAFLAIALSLAGALILVTGWPSAMVGWFVFPWVLGTILFAKLLVSPSKSIQLIELLSAYTAHDGSRQGRLIQSSNLNRLGTLFFLLAWTANAVIFFFDPPALQIGGYTTLVVLYAILAAATLTSGFAIRYLGSS